MEVIIRDHKYRGRIIDCDIFNHENYEVGTIKHRPKYDIENLEIMNEFQFVCFACPIHFTMWPLNKVKRNARIHYRKCHAEEN